MTNLEEMGKELWERFKKVDFHYLTSNQADRLAILKHALIYGRKEMTEHEIDGIYVLVTDIEEGIKQMREFCEDGSDYLSDIYNPDMLLEKILEDPK